MSYRQQQLTDSVIMVPPNDFSYNEQTAVDNEYQHPPNKKLTQEFIQENAMKEFNSMVLKLRSYGVEVLILDKVPDSPKVPDALFPNNWFSTRADGRIMIYPMKTENRSAEVQINELQKLIKHADYQFSTIEDIRQIDAKSATTQMRQRVKALEGTGSLVFHHPTSSVFAALSERCNPALLQNFCDQYHYNCFPLTTKSNKGKPVYHTNVMMSCGTDFAVIATEILEKSDSNQKSLVQLANVVKEVIEISENQMENSFCGNIIQLKNKRNEPLLLMSQSAKNGFTEQQNKVLQKHGSFVICSIPTIEHIGGGSCRCMVAENFLYRA